MMKSMVQKIKQFLKEKGISAEGARWLWSLIRPYGGKIAGLIALRCLITAVGVGSAVVNKYLVDYATAYLDVTGIILLAVGCSCFTLLGGVGLSMLSARMTERFTFHVRNTLYDHILDSVWSQRSCMHSGELLSRLTSDVNRIAEGIMTASTALASTALQLCLAFGLLWQYDRGLALFALCTVPFVGLFSFFMGRKLKLLQVQLQQTDADQRVFLQEQLSKADVLKAFQNEDFSRAQLRSLQEKRMNLVIRSNRCSVLMRFGVSAVFSGSYLFAFITGALKIASGAITYGTMTAFLSLVNQIQTPVVSLSRIASQWIGVLASATRAMEITRMDTEKTRQAPISRESVGVTAKNVCFSYGDDRQVVQDLSFTIAPGSIAAVMGPSGIGKTTLIRMLLGFVKPDSGEIAFCGSDGRVPCSEETRNLVSYVPQGNTLFSGTIADNLRQGKADATEEEMQAALKAACAYEFVTGLPKGLETPIGERSHGISEGQAQRIAIARAFLRPAPVLILDEATSALDEETETRILRHLSENRGAKTCIVISHRAGITRYADQLISL